MSPWPGGLPPAALARVTRQRAGGATGSFLSAPGAAAVAAVDLTPVGEVFGCLVMNLGWSGGFCGAWASPSGPGAWGWTSPVVTTGDARGSRNGSGPYVRAVDAAWRGALDRMAAEARALGADGVVGVRTTRARLDGTAVEFTARGTAVRGHRAPGTLWCAGLSAEDCAAALGSGFAPRALVRGLSVATKHEDPLLVQQRSSWGGTEVDGLTELFTRARADARRALTADARGRGSGHVVVDDVRLGTFDTQCGNGKDLHAEASFTGTLLAEVGPPGAGRAPAVLTVLPLNR